MKWTACRILWLLFAIATFPVFASDQASDIQADEASSRSDPTAELLKKVDQLVDQNIQLEEQNRQLIQEIVTLRQVFRSRPSEKTQAPKKAVVETLSSEASTPNQPVSPSTNQSTARYYSANSDDKTLLPQASDGNPAVFGEFNPGRGFTVASGELGTLNFSGYIVARYLNQLPPHQSETDHLGRPITVTPRQDFQLHRVMLFSQGWLFTPKLQYGTFVWTVQDTNQVAVGGALTYTFNKYMTLGGGWNAYPGTMSLQGSHPYWTSYDRVMADEYFRPFFSQGIFAQGNLISALQYRWMVGNNNSNLDTPAVKLERDLSGGFAFTWLPTTHKFGPRGAFGNFENHEKLAYPLQPRLHLQPRGSPSRTMLPNHQHHPANRRQPQRIRSQHLRQRHHRDRCALQTPH